MEQTILCLSREDLQAMLNESAERAIKLAQSLLPKFYTSQDICTMLNVTPQTLCLWQNKGILQPLRVGNRLIYTKDILDHALQNGLKKKYGNRKEVCHA